MTLNDVMDLFEFKLQALYSAEKRTVEILDEAASETTEPGLREAFEHHRDETREQVARIEKVASSLGKKLRVVDAPVVEGLVEEKRRFMAEDPVPEVMDLFNMAAAMKNEHLEIAAYEDLIRLAEQAGSTDLVEPLRANLKEEQATLEKLARFSTEGTLGRPATKEAKGEAAR